MTISGEDISVGLSPEVLAQVRRAVDTGEYASSSEVVREALREWSLEREKGHRTVEDLRSLWAQARGDDARGVSAEEVFSRLEGKYREMAETVAVAR